MAFAFLLFLVALTCSIAFGSSGQISESPTEAVRSTLTEVFRILEDEKLKDPANLMPRRHMLEEVIASHFDYTEMSKRALAAHWVPLTTGERDEFVELFKNFLSDRYAEKIEGYSGEQVSYLSERIEGNYAEVRTELRSSKVAIPMDYRLLHERRDVAYLRHHRGRGQSGEELPQSVREDHPLVVLPGVSPPAARAHRRRGQEKDTFAHDSARSLTP